MEKKKDGRGGARPGAGRKPKTEKKRFKIVHIYADTYALLTGIRNKCKFVSSLIIKEIGENTGETQTRDEKRDV